MPISTRSLVDVECDICGGTETIETATASASLDERGYRRIKISIEPLESRPCPDLPDRGEFVACKECLKRVRDAVKLPSSSDIAQLELEDLKKQTQVS